MLGEESQVDSSEHQGKVDFSSVGVEGEASEQRESVGEACKDGENSSYGEDVVEMSYYIVGVVKNNV